MAFEITSAIIALFIGSAILTASSFPSMFYACVVNVSAFAFELGADRVFAIGGFTAIQGAAGEQRGKLGDGKAK